MIFQYTYRKTDGSIAHSHVEASSRSAAMSLVQAKGQTIIRIDVANHVSMFPARKKVRWVVAVGCILVLGFTLSLFLMLLSDSKGGVAVSDNTTKVKKVLGKPTPKPASVTRQTNEVTKVVPVITNVVPVSETMVPTNVDNTIRPGFFRPTKVLEDGTIVDMRPPPLLKDPIERAFAAIATPGGMAIPFAAAMRRFSKEQVLEMINRPVEFSNEDSEVLTLKKTALQQVKDAFKEYLAAGKDLNEAIFEVDRQMRRESVQQATAYRGLAAVASQGDAEAVNKYVKMVNEELSEKGLRLLTVPPQFKLPENTEGSNQ